MENNKMTPAQALEILEKATAALTLNRADTITVITALQTLAAVLPEDSTVKLGGDVE